MTKEEFKKIVKSIALPKKMNIYYNIDDVKKTESYVKEFWNSNSNKYTDLLGIFVSTALNDKRALYFLEDGIIINKHFVLYDDIRIVCVIDKYFNVNINGVIFVTKDDKILLRFKSRSNSRFTRDVVNEMVERHKGLHSNEKKIEYYLNLVKFDEEDDDIETINKFFIYKRLLHITQEPHIIGELVRRFGFAEFIDIFNYSKNKHWGEYLKSIPKAYFEFSTLQIKKADKSLDKGLYEKNTKVFEDCRQQLLLVQKCNDVRGYVLYVSFLQDLILSATKASCIMDGNYIREYNVITKRLEEQIREEILVIDEGSKHAYLSMLKMIGDIYFGEIVTSKQKIKKHQFTKDLNKALKWYNLFIETEGCEDSAGYAPVMLNRAFIYKYGVKDIDANEDEMIYCLKEAANHGSKRACKYLAEYYISINSDEKDKWIQMAKSNGQKVRDSRSANEKIKEKVGMDLIEIGDSIGNFVNIGGQISNLIGSVSDILNTTNNIANGMIETRNQRSDLKRDEQRKALEHEQWVDGQRVKNKEAKAKNMKAERKADKKIAREEKRRK